MVALVSPDGVAPSRMVGVSASVNLPLHHKVQKFSSDTGSPGWSRKKGRKTVVVVWWWIRIWIHWQIEWSGFVDVVGSDVIVICLCVWWSQMPSFLLSTSSFASESTSKLDSRIRIRVRTMSGLIHSI